MSQDNQSPTPSNPGPNHSGKRGFSIHRLLGLSELAEQSWRDRLSFWMIIAMTFFLFGDQNLIGPNLLAIGSAFGLENYNADCDPIGQIDWYIGGLIPVFFFILGGFISVTMGYLGQYFARKRLLLISVILGELACLASAFSGDYTEFLIWRSLCGFGLGGVFPLIFSLIGDYFSDHQRGSATAWTSLAMGLGIAVGQLVAGITGKADPINGWRDSFIIMAAPSFLFAAVYWIFCPEPVRGGREKALAGGLAEMQDEFSHQIHLKDFKIILSTKTNIGAFLQGIPGTVPWGVFFVYLVHYYESNYDIPKDEAAFYLTVAALGIFVGTFFGGHIGNWLYNKRKVWQSRFSMWAVFLGIIPALFLLQFSPENFKSAAGNKPAPTVLTQERLASGELTHSMICEIKIREAAVEKRRQENLKKNQAGDASDSQAGFYKTLFLLLNFITGVIIAIPGPNVRAILLNTNIPRNRGSIFALYNLTDDLGRGFGPFISSAFLLMIPDRTLALSIAILFWIPCGLAWLLISANLDKDQAAAENTVREMAEDLRRRKQPGETPKPDQNSPAGS